MEKEDVLIELEQKEEEKKEEKGPKDVNEITELPIDFGQRKKAVEYKVTPFSLNKFFQVVYYDGEKNPSSLTAHERRVNPIANILNPPSEMSKHCSKEGHNFDLVLKFTGDGEFTLTHFVIRGGSHCTSVIKDGLLWIHDKQPDISRYSAKFNFFSREAFNNLPDHIGDNPVLFFETDGDSYFFQTNFTENLRGKYIHIKFMTPHQKAGNNIDIGYIGLVGFPEIRKENYVGILPPELDLAPPEVSLPVINGDPLINIKGESFESFCIYEPEKLIYVVSYDHYIRSFSLETGKLQSEFYGSSSVSALAVSDDRIFGTGVDKVGVWDRSTGKLLDYWQSTKLATHKSLCVYYFEGQVISGHSDGLIAIWNTKTGNCETVYSGHRHYVSKIIATATEIYSSAWDGSITIYNKSDGKKISTHVGDSLSCLTLGPQYIYACSYNFCQIHIFDRRNLHPIKKIPETPNDENNEFSDLEGQEGWFSIAYSNGKIYIGSANTSSISIWNEKDGALIQRLRGHQNIISSLSISGNRLISLSSEVLKIWNNQDSTGLQLLSRHLGKVKDLEYSDNTLYAACSDKTIKAIDLKTGKNLVTLSGHEDVITSISLIDDTLFSSGKDNTIRIWNRKEGKLEHTILFDAPVSCLAAQDEKLYAGTSDGFLQIFDNVTYEKLEEYPVEGQKLIRIIPTPELLATAWDDGIRVWNSTSIKENCLFLPLGNTHNRNKLNYLITEVSEVRRIRIGLETFPLYTIDMKVSDLSVIVPKFRIKRRYIEFTQLHEYLKDKYPNLVSELKFPILNQKPSEKELQSIRPLLTSYLNSILKVDDLRNDSKVLSFLSATISAMAITAQRLCVGFKDGSVRVLDMTALGTIDQDLYEVQAHPQKVTDMVTFKNNYLYTSSSDETIKIFELNSGIALYVLRGHKDYISSLVLVEEKLYSSGFDQTIRMWNIPLIMAPEYCAKVYNDSWLKEYAKTNPLDVDMLNVASSTGLVDPVRYILSNSKLKFNQPQGFGGPSPLYFALVNYRWNFFRELTIDNYFAPTDFEVKDRPSLEFLRLKARSDDVEFFDNLNKCGIKYPQVDVIGYSFLAFNEQNKLKTVKSWLQRHDINERGHGLETLLHYACNYGSIHGTRLILNEPSIQLNVTNENKFNPLHTLFDDGASNLVGHRGRRSLHTLFINRLDCAKLVLDFADSTNKVDLLSKNENLETVYSQVLVRYNRARKDMKGTEPRRFNEPVNEYQVSKQRKETFEKMIEILAACNEQFPVKSYRNKFARTNFWKKAIPYAIWLFLLILVGIGQSTKDSLYSYYFKKSIDSTFLQNTFNDLPPQTYYDISTISDFWAWYDGVFLPSLNIQEWHNIGDPVENKTGVFYSGHRLIGAARMSQKRSKNNCANTPDSFDPGYITICSSRYFMENTSTFGNGLFVYDQNGIGVYYGLDVWQPFSGGAFIQIVSPNLTLSLNQSEMLQANGWIDTFTRVISIDFTIYNVNLNLFGVAQFVIEFTPSGIIATLANYHIMQALRLEDTLDFIIIAFEIIIILFFIVEFLVQEFYEIYMKGYKYIFDLWNYYEWTIIFLFCSLIGIRVYTFYKIEVINLNASPTEFSDFLSFGQILTKETDILGVFILICFLRGVKFFRIPSDIGPASQAILDTIKAKQFLVFLGIFFFIFVGFSLAFHFAFGFTVYDFRDFETTLLTLARMLFGSFGQYQSMYESDRVLGPLLFIFFVFLMILIFLNLFIAVLTNTYTTIFQKNTETFQQYLTYLLIKDLYFTNGKSSAFDWAAAIFYFLKSVITRNPAISRPFYRFRHFNPLEDASERNLNIPHSTPLERDRIDNRFSNNKARTVYNYKQLDAMELEVRYAQTHVSNEAFYGEFQIFKRGVVKKLTSIKEELYKDRDASLRTEIKAAREEVRMVHQEVSSMLNRIEKLFDKK